MSAHTPGVWKNHGRVLGAPGLPCSAVAADTLLAKVYAKHFGDEREEKANADLIAAAPELLRVAELLVDWLNEEPGAHKLCDTARAAIAKATGSAT